MNINEPTSPENADLDQEIPVENLLPTKAAYFVGFLTLFLSGISGGLIGFACAKIFVTKPSQSVEIIFALISAIAICWSMSVVVTIGLKASVEFKSRKKLFPSSKRPSKLLN